MPGGASRVTVDPAPSAPAAEVVKAAVTVVPVPAVGGLSAAWPAASRVKSTTGCWASDRSPSEVTAAERVSVSLAASDTAKVAAPSGPLVPVGGSTVAEVPVLAVSATVAPSTGLPQASRRVTVTTSVADPPAVVDAVAGDTVEEVAETGPGVMVSATVPGVPSAVVASESEVGPATVVLPTPCTVMATAVVAGTAPPRVTTTALSAVELPVARGATADTASGSPDAVAPYWAPAAGKVVPGGPTTVTDSPAESAPADEVVKPTA